MIWNFKPFNITEIFSDLVTKPYFNDQVNTGNFQEDECVYFFSLCSQKVCQFTPKECVFKLGGVVYDFAPLARRDSNWAVDDDDRTLVRILSFDS